MALSECVPMSTDHRRRELVEHGNTLFPVACYHDNLSEIDVGWHWHDELEAVIIDAGQACVFIDGTEFVMKQGEAVFINSGVLHGFSGRESNGIPCRLHSVVFHPRLIGGNLDTIFWQKYLATLLEDSSRAFIRFRPESDWHQRAIDEIEKCWQACALENSGFEFAVREHLSRLILLLSENTKAAHEQSYSADLRNSERIKRMLSFIQDHFCEEVTLEDIARSANVSENECLRCFRRMLFCSPMQYVRQLRIQKAANLLVRTSANISDIAIECGFQDMSYFSKTFRQYKGMPPRQYRKMTHAQTH